MYILRNAQGHLRNSDENIHMSAAERGEMNPQEELRGLDTWATECHNRNAPGGNLPYYPHAHAQNLVNSQIENENL